MATNSVAPVTNMPAFGVQSMEGQAPEAHNPTLEALANLEHEQWIAWSKSLAHEVDPERAKRWESLWIPYNQLSEAEKDKDREWARKAYAIAKGVSTTQSTMSVEQRLERAEGLLAVLVAEKMSETPNPSGERKKGYPKDKSEYADPQDHAYPINDKEHVDAAARYFGKYKDRYSEAKRKEIKRRIDEAKKRFGIGGDKTESAAMSAADYALAMNEVLSIVEDAFTADEEPQALLATIREMLSSEANPRTRAQMYDADWMTDDFMREIKGYAGVGHK